MTTQTAPTARQILAAVVRAPWQRQARNLDLNEAFVAARKFEIAGHLDEVPELSVAALTEIARWL